MPFYDYYCEANGKTVEVFHSAGLRLKTWGEVCRYADISLGGTPSQAKAIRLISQVRPHVFRLKGMDKEQPQRKLEI